MPSSVPIYGSLGRAGVFGLNPPLAHAARSGSATAAAGRAVDSTSTIGCYVPAVTKSTRSRATHSGRCHSTKWPVRS